MNNLKLSYLPLFKDINKDDLSSLLKCLNVKEKTYDKNQTIIAEGSYIDSIGIVLEGSVQASKTDINGHRIIISNMQKNEMFAEAIVCSNIHVSPLNVEACEKSRILWIQFTRIVSTCASSCSYHTKLIKNMLEIISRKNMFLNSRLHVVAKKSLRDKITEYLIQQSIKNKSREFKIDLNRNQLADYLASDRSALSRELSKMMKEELIEYKGNNFIIHDI